MSFITDLEKITPEAPAAPAVQEASAVTVEDLKDLQKAFNEKLEAFNKDIQDKMHAFFEKEKITPVGDSIKNDKESEVDEIGSNTDL